MMARVTDDPNDSDLTRGSDDEPTQQAPAYLVLSGLERAKGFIRPVRTKYVHTQGENPCGRLTVINSQEIAETYARQPNFYGATYCVGCYKHLPVSEFTWDKDGTIVGL